MGEGRQKRHTELLNYNQMLTTGTGNISISQTQFSGEKNACVRISTLWAYL